MSTGPPKPAAGINFGSPLAYVVAAPVLGSTRVILPAARSVTYSAPSGPTVLPEPPCRPATKRCAVGSPEGPAAVAADGTTDASSASIGESAIRTVVASPWDSPLNGPSAAEGDGERRILGRPSVP